jgi:diguanylate cyclase (GGDEF)-like protein
MLDLDHFKKLNDTYGHEAGDAALVAVGALLRENTRTEDIACRYGGEELTVILPDSTLESAIIRAQSLCAQIAALRIRHNRHTLQITASLGVSAFPDNADTPDQLLHAADMALYQAKKQGRNRVIVAAPPTESVEVSYPVIS